MFADLHHLHQFVSLDQGGSYTGYKSTVSGTDFHSDVFGGDGKQDTYFGATHLSQANAHEYWLQDDQAMTSPYLLSTGDPASGDLISIRNEGMFNSYSAVQAFWSDTTLMDNLRGGDATGLATPGDQEISFDSQTFTANGIGNTTHMYSQDTYASMNNEPAGQTNDNFTFRVTHGPPP